tara:strand:+ start:2886 stop:3029 length:144 start_codon:yes stop_codon:yes gene_type:complete
MQAKKFVLNISQNYSFAILRPLQEAIRNINRAVCWFVLFLEFNYQLN